MNLCLKMKRKAKYETSLMKNGRLLLEELIAFCNGKANSICVFSTEELKRATNNYDQRQCILQDSDFKLYSRVLQKTAYFQLKGITQEKKDFLLWKKLHLALLKGSQMSVHKNVLKLLGRCLETKYPTPVYEFLRDKILSSYINPTGTIHFEPLTQKCRAQLMHLHIFILHFPSLLSIEILGQPSLYQMRITLPN